MLAYLHIPFCDSKCHYCAFNSYDNKDSLKKAYMHKITDQLAFEIEKFSLAPQSLTSLFIGGGTPSSVQASWYEPFFTMIQPYLDPQAEITTEANPRSATPEWLSAMKHLGINRLSLGVQSFDEKKLAFLGRNHSKELAIKAVENAFKSGIENISLDLIYGSAHDTPELLKHDLAIASSLPINHLSAYALTIEENTPFFKQSNVVNASETLARLFVEEIIKAGFPQYEISNFGVYQSRHNRGYWERKNYLGIGAGAVGCLHHERYYPHESIEAYVTQPRAQSIETLSLEDIHIEKIFLGLRSCIGINLEEFHEKEHQKITLLLQEGKLTCHEGRVYNTDYFLSDEIALFITQ